MRAFCRFIGSFIFMIAIGYAVVFFLVPLAPPAASNEDGVMTGRSAAVRLSREAAALIGRKPAETE